MLLQSPVRPIIFANTVDCGGLEEMGTLYTTAFLLFVSFIFFRNTELTFDGISFLILEFWHAKGSSNVW